MVVVVVVVCVPHFQWEIIGEWRCGRRIGRREGDATQPEMEQRRVSKLVKKKICIH